MSHRILLVHGMGKPSVAMFDGWKAALKRIYEEYSPEGQSFEDQFDCVPINYDGAFEERRTAWAEQVDEILQNAAGAPGVPAKEDLESLTEDNFFTTHILDVLLYRFVPPVAEDVRARVVSALLKAVDETPSGTKVSVLAHSLGTSVLHDAVNAMYETPRADGTVLSPVDFRFHAICMLANVSRTLETRWDVYKPRIRPGIANDASHAADYFLSASHRWDPLVALRRYSPMESWPDPATRLAGRAALLSPGLLQRWNVHDFSHYLDDPFVHIPMLRFLRYEKFITRARQKEAEDAFMKDNPISRFDDYRKRLEALIVGEAEFSWKRLIEVFKGFAKAVRDFSEN